MAEDFLHQPEIDLIRRLRIGKRCQELIQISYCIVGRVKWIVVSAAGKYKDFLVIKYIGTRRIKALRIINLNMLSAIFNLGNNRIVSGINIRKHLTALVNKHPLIPGSRSYPNIRLCAT